MISDSSNEPENLSSGMDGVVQAGVLSLHLDIRPPPPVGPKFREHKCLGKFRTTEEGTLSPDPIIIPKLQRRYRVDDLGAYLGTFFRVATLIADYKAFNDQKQKHFLEWIISSKFYEKVEKQEYKKPDFISFVGRITDSLTSPGLDRYGDWKLFAAKFNDAIYLWQEKGGFSGSGSKESYYVNYFKHMMTMENPDTTMPNEFDKVFGISEVTFGSHQLLVLHELEAVDENWEWVDFRIGREYCPKGTSSGKLLKYWAQAVVAGVPNVVLGSRSEEGFLTKIDETTPTAIAADHRKIFWRESTCCEFQDRFFNWIRSHFKENDPKVVKKFVRRQGSQQIDCEDVQEKDIPKLLLPSWFVDHFAGPKTSDVGVDPSLSMPAEVLVTDAKPNAAPPTDNGHIQIKNSPVKKLSIVEEEAMNQLAKNETLSDASANLGDSGQGDGAPNVEAIEKVVVSPDVDAIVQPDERNVDAANSEDVVDKVPLDEVTRL